MQSVLTQSDPDTPEQMRVRTEKRARLLAAGIEPYPVTVPRTHSLAEVRSGWSELVPGTVTTDEVSVTGRVMHARVSGKLCFATVADGDGTRLQVMLSLADIGEDSFAAWKSDVDLGDLVSVTGPVGTSKRGELSVFAREWRLAAKALRPLPNLHNELSEESRVRNRHIDLIVRPEAREHVQIKATVLRSLRETFHSHGFVEVETPILHAVHGGAAARPFRTHVNALGVEMSLRIATELYLKRCVVGGLHRVYEIGRTFRNEGIDTTHSPEFTMVESYAAFGTVTSMADLTRELVVAAATAVGRTTVVDGTGSPIDLTGPWPTRSVHELVSAAVGEHVDVDTDETTLRLVAARRGVESEAGWTAGEIVLELYEKLVERTIRDPTFVSDFPADVRPLARARIDEPRLADAYDLVIGGFEVAPIYTELTDPVVQRERLTAQSLRAAAGDPEAMELDEDFIAALEVGMPPTGGMGLGLDRLVMLLTGVGIRETILFPLLRPVTHS